jgi:hypothetical protein
MLHRSFVAFALLSSMVMPGTTRAGDAIEREGRARAAPVIAALERFHRDHGHYPKQLDQLIPGYVHDSAALHIKGETSLVYTPDARNYTLEFSWEIPSTGDLKSLVYFSKEKEWHPWVYR